MKNIDLSSSGLGEKETDTYLALLELGEVNLSTLIRKTGVKRTTLYDIVESLHKKGLIGYTKHKKRTFYFAEDPRVLMSQMDERRQKLETVLPELLSITNSLVRKPKIRYYEGVAGIKQAYEDTLKYPDQELLGWVSEKALSVLGRDFLYAYLERRLKRKIWVRAIAPRVPDMEKYAGEDPRSLRKTLLISKNEFPFEVEVNLYGKRNIAIMSFEENFAMIIESEKIYKTMKSMFEMSWLFADHSKTREL